MSGFINHTNQKIDFKRLALSVGKNIHKNKFQVEYDVKSLN